MQIEIGKVLKPQGIKGEIKVLPLSKPDFLAEAHDIAINGMASKVEHCSLRDGYAYLMISTCHDRDTAESLRDYIITANTDDLSELDDEQYFFDDLIDCEVYDENNTYLGKVIEVENYGSTDILTIHEGFSNTSCPFLRDVFVSVDTVSKKITVDSQRYREVTDYED